MGWENEKYFKIRTHTTYSGGEKPSFFMSVDMLVIKRTNGSFAFHSGCIFDILSISVFTTKKFDLTLGYLTLSIYTYNKELWQMHLSEK